MLYLGNLLLRKLPPITSAEVFHSSSGHLWEIFFLSILHHEI